MDDIPICARFRAMMGPDQLSAAPLAYSVAKTAQSAPTQFNTPRSVR